MYPFIARPLKFTLACEWRRARINQYRHSTSICIMHSPRQRLWVPNRNTVHGHITIMPGDIKMVHDSLTWVPTSTWIMTAAGLPVTCAYPCAALNATISLGDVTIVSAWVPFVDRWRSSSSSMAGWSDPQLTKTWSMPTCARVCKKREEVVSTMIRTVGQLQTHPRVYGFSTFRENVNVASWKSFRIRPWEQML